MSTKTKGLGIEIDGTTPNLYRVVGLTIIFLGSFVWLEYHNKGLKAYINLGNVLYDIIYDIIISGIDISIYCMHKYYI
jgi:hypothetical protein